MLDLAPAHLQRRPVTAAARLLLGGPVALLTTHDRGRDNVMPLAWHMPISARPPLVAVAIEQSRHTAEMVRHSEQFALSLPGRALLHHVQYLASLSGAEVDKFEATQLATFAAAHVEAPLVEGCLAWIECAVQEILPFGDHLLCIALVVAVQVDPQAFDERWLLGDAETRPLQFLGDHHYTLPDRVLEARLPQRGEAPERVLADRAEEELELTREARERRAERMDELAREMTAGRVVDVDAIERSVLPLWAPTPGIVVPDFTLAPEPPPDTH
ncbi:MAG: flavin reductase family protein [Dehalococcoidia bacterium]|nr:flavin reductase family protein [Dehalococcoidia bacterium]